MIDIKFKAWDKIDEKVREVIEINFKLKQVILLNAYTDGCYIRNFDEVELMQDTGLKDENGTEICDGDILSYRHTKIIDLDESVIDTWDVNFKEYTRNYVVEYSNTHHKNGYRLRNRSIHFPVSQATINNGKCEVIGNIFENPELLEGIR